MNGFAGLVVGMEKKRAISVCSCWHSWNLWIKMGISSPLPPEWLSLVADQDPVFPSPGGAFSPLIPFCRRALTGRTVAEWRRENYEALLSQQRHLSSKNNNLLTRTFPPSSCADSGNRENSQGGKSMQIINNQQR